MAPALGSIRLRIDRQQLVPGIQNTLQSGNGELRRTQEYQSHNLTGSRPSYHSPAF